MRRPAATLPGSSTAYSRDDARQECPRSRCELSIGYPSGLNREAEVVEASRIPEDWMKHSAISSSERLLLATEASESIQDWQLGDQQDSHELS